MDQIEWNKGPRAGGCRPGQATDGLREEKAGGITVAETKGWALSAAHLLRCGVEISTLMPFGLLRHVIFARRLMALSWEINMSVGAENVRKNASTIHVIKLSQGFSGLRGWSAITALNVANHTFRYPDFFTDLSATQTATQASFFKLGADDFRVVHNSRIFHNDTYGSRKTGSNATPCSILFCDRP